MGLMAVVPIGPVSEELAGVHSSIAISAIVNALGQVYDRGGSVLADLASQLAEEASLGEDADESVLEDLRERIEAVHEAFDDASDAADNGIDRAASISADRYSIEGAYQAFANAFHDTINALCPVRTGFLRSTCDCIFLGDSILCVADAEYAQYVEYGTSRMAAQPYFEPAIEDGVRAMQPILNALANDAQYNGKSDGQAGSYAVQNAAASASGDIASVVGGLVGFVIMLIISAFFDMLESLIDEIFSDTESYEIMII